MQQNLATLAGRKYHGKKNHCNAFVKEHPDYVYEEMNRSNIEECLAFGDMWCERRMSDDPSLVCEKCAIHEALDNFGTTLRWYAKNALSTKRLIILKP